MDSLLALGRHSLVGLRALVVMTLLVGLAYPLAITGVAQTAFDWRASGSLVRADGTRTTSYDDAVGSALAGQAAAGPEWFHPRPSAAGDGWDPLATGGSNLGPQNPDLVATIEERRAAVAEEEGVDPADVPVDALTASASGLDPHVSPAYAALQVARVARENGLAEAQVRALVAEHTHGRTLGFLGEPRVDVLALNTAVAELRD
jgi:K+-transporting ATPase ATPase C chain